MKYVLYSVLMMCLSGCATEAKYKEKLQTWIGHSSSELVSTWGIPTNTMTMSDGNKAYEYNNVGGTTAMGQYNELTNSYMVTSNTRWCKTTFIVNEVDLILTWRYVGNACVSE